MKRDLVSLENFSTKEILEILNLTEKLKKDNKPFAKKLSGKSVGLIFQKPSNRTRVSFEVGIFQLGGNCIYLGPKEINIGIRETTADVSKTLSRYLDLIVARTFKHEDIIELTENATIPVINGLSDLYHPCQALTDIFSIKEKFNKLKNINLAYIGDGNNVCHSLMLAASKVGMNISIATPKGYEPTAKITNLTKKFAKESGSKITITNCAKEATKFANVIYSDVWVSMGQETETKKRLKIFKDFQINKDLLKHANKNHIFMHCLPAHRGYEVTSDVIDGPNSIIFDQAENRLHTQKAIILFLMSNKQKSK